VDRPAAPAEPATRGRDRGAARAPPQGSSLFGWTAYATEIAATFAPEYRDPERDTSKALRAAGVFTLALAVLIPIGLGGAVGDAAIAENPGGIYIEAFEAVVGSSGSMLITLVLVAAFLMVMNSATADAGRALYGIARDDMTVKQLNHLNRRGTPDRAIAVAAVLNIGLLLFVGNVLGIIFASNVGYILMMFFVLSGFVLLRRDRPAWPRPIRLRNFWIPIAVVLAVYNLVLGLVGFFSPAEAGYGGTTEQLVAAGVLLSSFLLFLYRRLVQDRGSLNVREITPALPPTEAAPADRPVVMTRV